MIERRLPNLVLEAAVTRRRVDLARPGRRLLLIVHGRGTSDAVAAAIRAARRRVRDPAELIVAAVPDLSPLPRLLRPLAPPLLAKAFRAAAGLLPPGADPAEHVVILPDADGAIVRALGLRPAEECAAVVLAAADGAVLDVTQGGDPVAEVLRVLQA